MKKFAVAGLMISALVVPVGCSGETGSASQPSTGETSETPIPASTPSKTPAPPATTVPNSPTAGLPSKTIGVHRRNVVSTTLEQQAVADTYLKYLLLRLTAYHKLVVPAELNKLASGKALSNVSGYVSELRSRKQHAIGELWVDIPVITVKGNTATVKSCMDNTSIDADQAGKPVENPVPYLTATGTLQKAGGTSWVVSNVAFTEQRCR